MSQRKRVLVSIGVLAVFLAIYAWFLGAQTFWVLETRNMARRLPLVKHTPVALPDLSVAQASGMKLSYFGYEFEVPWTDIDTEKTKVIGGNKAIIAFYSGNVLSVWSGRPHEFMNGLLEAGKIDRDSFRKLYGDETLQSDYTFKRLILETTPDKVALFGDEQTDTSQAVLLLVKAMCVPGEGNSGIYSIQGKEFKGFQYGLPRNPPTQVSVELFPTNGHLDLIFGQKTNGPTVISQADINRIVQTIHAVPTQTDTQIEGVHGTSASIDHPSTTFNSR